MVIWITGFPGTGKTTLGKLLKDRIPNSILLDGDEIRKKMSFLGYTKKDRLRNALRIILLAYELQRSKIVICCTVSLFHLIHRINRLLFFNYIEIYLKNDLGELRKRKPEVYKYLEISDFEVPLNPDIVIEKNIFNIEEILCGITQN